MASPKSFRGSTTDRSRVFLIDGRARHDHKPEYMSFMRAGAPSQSFGDVTRIEIPSDEQYGQYIEVGVIRGAEDRPTISLVGKYALDLKSKMLQLARQKCSVDLHINFGVCTDPTDYNVFTKKLIVEDAILTDWSADDLGSLSSSDTAEINETTEVSARVIYEVVQSSFAKRGGDVVTNELLAVTMAGNVSCGECDESNDGCQKIYAISLAAGGSPGTPADVVFSLDSGLTWYAHDIDSIGAVDDPSGIAAVGPYLVVVSEESESAHYTLISEITPTTDPVFSEVSTGIVAGNGPRAISAAGRIAFVAGANGYIYRIDEVTSGFTLLDAGVATTDDYLDIHAFSSDFAVAVGKNGAVSKTENGFAFSSVTRPVGYGIDLKTVQVRSRNVWQVGSSNGNLYVTVDGGVSWTAKGFPGSGSGSVESLHYGSDSAGVMSHTTAAGAGRLLRTTNNGYDWVVLPEGSGRLPAADRINDAIVCYSNVDVIIGVGLDDDGADGYIVAGSD